MCSKPGVRAAAREVSVRATATIGLMLLLGGTGTLHAQTPLSSFGQTELQENTGQGVQVVCGRLAAATALNALQTDLFTRCREMVHTGNALGGAGGATGSALGLNEDELAQALQQLTTEEAASTGTLATETSADQVANVATRLSAIRSGAGLITTAGFGPLGPSDSLLASRKHARGGAAGDSDFDTSRLGGFINGKVGFGDRDATTREDGFDFDARSITGGLDYRFTDNLVAGVAVGWGSSDVDFDSTPTVGGGDVESDGYSISAYGTYYVEQFYLDGIITYGSNDFDLNRRIVYDVQNRTATASSESDQINLSIGGGYNFSRDALTFGPYARLDYLDMNIDGYTERGAGGLVLQVDEQDVDSLVTVLGLQGSMAISQSFGVLIPNARFEWNHEHRADSRTIRARYVHELILPGQSSTDLLATTDKPDRDFFILGIGVSGVFKNGIQAFVDYETILALDRVTSHLISGGLRWEF